MKAICNTVSCYLTFLNIFLKCVFSQAYLKYTADREQAVQMYKEKKMATYNLLKRKTKKGQPNLNAQMELLLQKIQQSKQ